MIAGESHDRALCAIVAEIEWTEHVKRLDKEKEKALRDACRLVERFARSIGDDCMVVFVSAKGRGIGRSRGKSVSVAPAAWSGDTSDATLYKALKRAQKEARG